LNKIINQLFKFLRTLNNLQVTVIINNIKLKIKCAKIQTIDCFIQTELLNILYISYINILFKFFYSNKYILNILFKSFLEIL